MLHLYLIEALPSWTCEIRTYCDQLKRERNARMALEIKGLKGKAVKAGSMFDRLNTAYDKLIEAGTAHAADVESLPAQFEALQDDITFAVQTLGNSVNGSGATDKPKEEPKVVTGETAGQGNLANQEVGQAAHGTFHE